MRRSTDDVPDEIRNKVATWERHGQTIMLAVVTATLAFTGRFMWGVNAQLTEIVSENRHLAIQVAKLEGTIIAMQTNYITRNEFAPWTDRIRTIENGRK